MQEYKASLPGGTVHRRAQIAPPQRLELRKDVLSDDVEKALSRFYGTGTETELLLIDFQEASFVEIAALLNCMATIVDRAERKLETKLGLPKNQGVLDFLRVWRFFEALQDATGTRYHEYILEEDRALLDSPQKTYTGIGGGLELLEYDPDWTECRTTQRNFFEFTTFSQEPGKPIVPDSRFSTMPRHIAGRWTGALIQQVLQHHLEARFRRC